MKTEDKIAMGCIFFGAIAAIGAITGGVIACIQDSGHVTVGGTVAAISIGAIFIIVIVSGAAAYISDIKQS